LIPESDAAAVQSVRKPAGMVSVGHCQVPFFLKRAKSSFAFGGIVRGDKVFADFADMRAFELGMAGGEHFGKIGLGGLAEVLLARGTGWEKAEKMLHRFLAGVGGFFRGNRERNVADEGEVLFLGLVGDGEIEIAWEERIFLDKVGTPLFGEIDSLARFFGTVYGDGAGARRAPGRR